MKIPKNPQNPLIWIPILFVVAHSVLGDILLSEVMYDPSVCPDTDCEWIEIYNNGSQPVNLAQWKVNNNDFDDFIILPQEFIIIARKLIDSAGGTSFEAIYGNNDGVWDTNDDSYKAVDGNFQLANAGGLINISSAVGRDILLYNATWGGNGNGRTIVKINLSQSNSASTWQEGQLNGTPGYSEFLPPDQLPPLLTAVNITNAPPTIVSLAIAPDDSPLPGIQLAPSPFANISLAILVNATDANGLSDLAIATAAMGNTSVTLAKTTTTSLATYSGILQLPSLAAGFYNLSIQIMDTGNGLTIATIPIEVFHQLTIANNQSTIDFGPVAPGSISSPAIITVAKTGTMATNVELSGSDLIATGASVPVNNIVAEVNGISYQLSFQPTPIPLNLNPGASSPFAFTLNAPLNLPATSYIGVLTIAAIAI